MPTSLQVIINIVFMEEQLQPFHAFSDLMAEFHEQERILWFVTLSRVWAQIDQGIVTEDTWCLSITVQYSQAVEFQWNGACLCYHFYDQKIRKLRLSYNDS